MKNFRTKAIKFSRTVTVYILVVSLLFLHKIPAASADGSPSVREVIRAGFYGFCESIDISEYNVLPEDLSFLFSSIIKDDPYLFFVDTTMSYSFEPGGRVLSLRPGYKMRGEEVMYAWECCREWVKMLADEAKKYESEEQKALYLHDRICEFIEYDKSLESDNLYSMLISGEGTCQAYTLAYVAVLRECGIEAHYAASDTIEHIWNYVMIDGEWYHADLTWDDSASTEQGEVSRRHFLLSDEAAEQRGHKDWYSFFGVACSSDKYLDYDFSLTLQDAHMIGDGNHDGHVDLADLLYLRRALSASDTESGCANCFDVDGNGAIDLDDAGLLRKKLLGAD